MKKIFSLAICVMALLFAGCEQNDPTIGNYKAKAFSVSADKQVVFSPGNLQYHPAKNIWRFAERQSDRIGEANRNCSSTYNGWLDLFGWSTSANNYGVTTSIDNADYSGSFVDWGTNKIGNDAPNTWRTLTANEWNYMVFNRSNADNLKGIAHVSGTNGLILLPDDWECPSGIIFKSGFHSDNSTEAYGQYQTFTTDQWSKLEAAGAVFLPAAGVRYGSDVYDEQNVSNYWSATNYRSNNAYFFFFYSDAAFLNHCSRSYSLSVRLVKDL